MPSPAQESPSSSVVFSLAELQRLATERVREASARAERLRELERAALAADEVAGASSLATPKSSTFTDSG
jgi:hypothetical protein